MKTAPTFHPTPRVVRPIQHPLQPLVIVLQRHPQALGLVLLIWTLALLRVLYSPLPPLPLVFNWTPSLPYHVAWLTAAPSHPQRGELILYAFHGAGARLYPGLSGQPFFKRIAGVAGDRIQVRGRDVFVNGVAMGHAKPHAFDGQGLQPIAEQTIAAGYVYVQGTHPDSFDSRYQASGLVPIAHILARVHPLF